MLRELTAEDYQRYVRIAIYLALGALGNYGVSAESWTPLILTIGGVVANLVWSAWGMRLNGKIRELMKFGMDPDSAVQPIIVEATPKGRAIAEAVPGVLIEGSRQAKSVASGADK